MEGGFFIRYEACRTLKGHAREQESVLGAWDAVISFVRLGSSPMAIAFASFHRKLQTEICEVHWNKYNPESTEHRAGSAPVITLGWLLMSAWFSAERSC